MSCRSKFRASRVAILLLVGLALPATLAAGTKLYENQLLGAVDSLLVGDHRQALAQIQQLLVLNPDSRLGYLVHADLLAAQAGLEKPIDALAGRNDQGLLQSLRKQLLARWRFATDLKAERAGRIPARLALHSQSEPDLIYVDLPASRLYLFSYRDGTLEATANYYVSIGRNGTGKQRKGDRKTPVGIYHITSYIPGKNLHQRYGSGALPISYPNPLDRLKQRTGHGIWLHGTEPGWVNRSPRATDGCVSLSNSDFEQLYQALGKPFPTPVIIDDQPEWVTATAENERNPEFPGILDRWYGTWQRRAPTSLLEFYTDPEQSVLFDTTATDRNTRLVDTALYSYPGEIGHMLAILRFSKGNDQTRTVHQYWKRQSDKDWKIISETQLDPE